MSVIATAVYHYTEDYEDLEEVSLLVMNIEFNMLETVANSARY